MGVLLVPRLLHLLFNSLRVTDRPDLSHELQRAEYGHETTRFSIVQLGSCRESTRGALSARGTVSALPRAWQQVAVEEARAPEPLGRDSVAP